MYNTADVKNTIRVRYMLGNQIMEANKNSNLKTQGLH